VKEETSEGAQGSWILSEIAEKRGRSERKPWHEKGKNVERKGRSGRTARPEGRGGDPGRSSGCGKKEKVRKEEKRRLGVGASAKADRGGG